MKAAIYARISRDMAEQGLGVERQLQDCRAKAKAMNWSVVDEYVDNDISASKNKPRPQYERLLTDLATDKLDALVVYDLDRLTRRPIELEHFIDLAQLHKIALANVSGDVDLATENGRMIARIKGAVARQEAERIATRVARQKKQAAESGRVLGGRYRLYGYVDRQRTEIEPTEAKHVRKMAEDYLAGRSVRSITRQLNLDEVVNTQGSRWLPQQVKRILLNPAYAGQRVFHGEVVASGGWPAILDLTTHQKLVAKFDAGTRSPTRNTRTYLLSGIVYCTLCNTNMHGGTNGPGGAFKSYRCNPSVGGCGRLSRNAAKVDALMLELTAAALSKVPVIEEPIDTSELEAVNTDIEALSDARAAGIIPMAEYLKQYQILNKKKDTLVKDATKVSVPAMSPEKFLKLDDVDLQREIIRTFFPAIGIKPARKGVRFSHEQLKF